MRLFRKKRPDWEDGERCPRCRERLPEGAIECMMCGLALAPLRGGARQARRDGPALAMGVLVWAMMAIACWHLAVLVPDRFWGGIVGAFLAALAGGLVSGFALPSPGLPSGNPPGLVEAVFAIPGALAALGLSYAYGSSKDRARGIVRP